MKNWYARFTSLGITESDSDEVAMWKRLLTGATFFGIFNLPGFGIIIWLFGAKISALAMFAYAAIIAVSLPIFLLNKKFTWYRVLHAVLLAVAPGIYTITMGGVLSSGMLLIWSMWAPIAALASGPRNEARRVALLSTLVIVVTSIAVRFTPTIDQPPQILSEIIGAMNLMSVGAFLFIMVNSFVAQRDSARSLLKDEKARSEELLLNVLPESIAQRLHSGETEIADRYDGVTILFADMVGFTSLSERSDAKEVVALLNDIFTRFDRLADDVGVEKIRTIGDAYMAVAGAPISREDHAEVMVQLAIEMAKELDTFRNEKNLEVNFRIGINSGSVIGAIIGKSKFHYDVWGDAVNLAARMESHGIPGRIQITTETKELLDGKYQFESRGPVEVKGKGLLETWFVTAPTF